MNLRLKGALSFVLLVVISLPNDSMINIHGDFRLQTHQHPHIEYHIFHKPSKYEGYKIGKGCVH